MNLNDAPALPAGLLIRTSAAILDALCVLLIADATVHIARLYGYYLPPELTFVLIGLCYTAGLMALFGSTPGKMFCGVQVISADGRPLNWLQGLLREFAKLLSVLPFGLGFLWGATNSRRRTWHDLIAGTRVVLANGSQVRRRSAAIVSVIVAATAIGWYVWDPVECYLATRRMAVPSSVQLACEVRDPAVLKDVRSSTSADEMQCVQWITAHAMGPTEYAVQKAREHQLLIFGEMHEQGDTLRWFNEAIPALYEQGGVTCIAMEVLLASDDAAIEKLVTADAFDREAAARIARHQPWGLWGWKEYWDVLETVWRVNHIAQPGRQKLRLVGLDRPVDAPSLVMMGVGDVPVRDAPVWEKLRAWRLPRVLGVMIMRDGAMAREAEKEIFEKHERAVVWIGAMHAAVGCRLPGRERWGQFGLMLHHRYGEQVFQIRLHQAGMPASALGLANTEAPQMATFIERILAQSGRTSVGFDMIDSPFALLRDPGELEYVQSPTTALGDIAEGYIYLKPWRELRHCAWQAGYVTDEMFTKYQPMYEGIARRAGMQAKSAADMDTIIQQLK